MKVIPGIAINSTWLNPSKSASGCPAMMMEITAIEGNRGSSSASRRKTKKWSEIVQPGLSLVELLDD
ncbi:hypothetical protein [Achromobacter kerstersii]|uniref:hypothetical protein n=1 Tax=Achromobacter kerstersii TaxID=1353890 RepID=UPI00158245B6|nr:hypothetical protein [Achromobacter kerstersii]